jgi:hypothetical protein
VTPLSQVVGYYGFSMSNAMKSLGTDAAVAAGMGRGEYVEEPAWSAPPLNHAQLLE